MQSTFIYQVRVRAKAGRNQFEAYFIEKPDPAEVIDAIQAEIKSLREPVNDERDAFCDDPTQDEINEEQAQSLETLIELVKLVKKFEPQQIRVAGTAVGEIDIQGIPALARDPNRTLQELIA